MSIKTIFKDQKLPESYQVPLRKNYDNYLVNGSIKKWSGKVADVYSPIYSENTDGIISGSCFTSSFLMATACMIGKMAVFLKYSCSVVR